MGATLGWFQGTPSQPEEPALVAQQPGVPPGGGASRHFRPGVFAGRPAPRGTSGPWLRPSARPRRGRLRFRSGLPSESGLGTSGNCASSEAVLVPTLKSGSAGLVWAPFFQGHVLAFLKGRPRLFLFPPRRSPGLVSCDRALGAPRLPALLRARARPGLLRGSQRRRPFTLGCGLPPRCAAVSALSRAPCALTRPSLALRGSSGDGGAPQTSNVGRGVGALLSLLGLLYLNLSGPRL